MATRDLVRVPESVLMGAAPLRRADVVVEDDDQTCGGACDLTTHSARVSAAACGGEGGDGGVQQLHGGAAHQLEVGRQPLRPHHRVLGSRDSGGLLITLDLNLSIIFKMLILPPLQPRPPRTRCPAPRAAARS